MTFRLRPLLFRAAMAERRFQQGQAILNSGAIAVRLAGSHGDWWGRATCGEGWTTQGDAFYYSQKEAAEQERHLAEISPGVTVRRERFQCARVGGFTAGPIERVCGPVEAVEWQ